MSEQVLTITIVLTVFVFVVFIYIICQTAGFLFRVALILNVFYHLFHILPHLYEVFI